MANLIITATTTKIQSQTYRPHLVIIISVPKSWNLSHNSFVSRWHCRGAISSQLLESTKRDFVCNAKLEKILLNGSSFMTIIMFKVKWKYTGICSGVNRSSSEAHGGDANEVCGVSRCLSTLRRVAASVSLHCSTSTSSSISAYRSSGPATFEMENF